MYLLYCACLLFSILSCIYGYQDKCESMCVRYACECRIYDIVWSIIYIFGNKAFFDNSGVYSNNLYINIYSQS